MSKYFAMSIDNCLIDEAQKFSPKETKTGAVKEALKIGLAVLRGKGTIEDRLERIETRLDALDAWANGE